MCSLNCTSCCSLKSNDVLWITSGVFVHYEDGRVPRVVHCAIVQRVCPHIRTLRRCNHAAAALHAHTYTYSCKEHLLPSSRRINLAITCVRTVAGIFSKVNAFAIGVGSSMRPVLQCYDGIK
jgi:hypothetical protein